MIAISKPLLGEAEQVAVGRVLNSGVLAQGPRVAEFERDFAAFVGVKHAIATSNGTTALHAALLAHGIGPGDEVITSPFTFIASVNSILYCGAKPVFVDIDESFTLDPLLIEAAITPKTRAIMPVHLYGQPAAMDAICAVAERHNLIIVEDACQAHGATFARRNVGSFDTGCFSFYATKNMTTGEGGMITTDDDAVAQQARQIISHGMKVRYYHNTVGYNYRMTDLAAAIGIEQLKRLPEFNERRIENAQFYDGQFAALAGVITPQVWPLRSHVYHQYSLRFTAESGLQRDDVAETLSKFGVGSGIYYPVPAHRQAAMKTLGLGDANLPVSERMATEVLSIPVHPGLSDHDRTVVANTVLAVCSQVTV